jgi:endonuclease YncB( thermonuclease family)
MNFKVYLLAAGLVLAALPALGTDRPPKTIVGYPRVADGDTLVFIMPSGNVRVRLWGIDAPELHQLCDDDSYAAGQLSTVALRSLISSDPVTCDEVSWDTKWDRPLSRCRVDGREVNALMVEHGLAWAYLRYTNYYAGDEDYARLLRRGVHSHNCELPWVWRRNHKR